MFIFHTKYHQNQHFHPLTEFYNYLSFDIGLSSVNSHHRFGETVAIIPGTTHHLPDLFLTPDGVAMLMDEVWKFTVLNLWKRNNIFSPHCTRLNAIMLKMSSILLYSTLSTFRMPP